MSQVGAFPGMQQKINLTRAPVNPMDRSTIVSVYPKEIPHKNPTISPGYFLVPAAPDNGFSRLVVGPSSWWKEMEEGQPWLEIPTSSMEIAASIIRDWANGLVACNMTDTMPGLFFLPGDVFDEIIEEKYAAKLKEARAKQDRWYFSLVKMADILWARSNGNPLSISDDARLAAEKLQLKNKAWMQDFTTITLVNCPACGVLRNNNFPICQHCKVIIDKTKFDELGLEFAK